MDPYDERPHAQVNYLYFGALFILLVFLSTGSIFIKENLNGSRFFFFLYAIGQVALETSALIFIGWMVRKLWGSFCFALFIGLSFVILILHVLDFMVDRILDLSVWDAIRVFVLDETLDNFIYLLEATGLSLWVWALFFALLAAVPVFGYLLYKGSDWLIANRKCFLKREWFLQAFFCIPCALFLWDFSASKVMHPDAYSDFVKSLPWKCTFLHPQSVHLNLPSPLAEPPKEKTVQLALEKERGPLAQRPNIYIFVIESLREDCITAEGAPHLSQFKKENIQFPLTLSNGNGSHISWFSIFHSTFPLYWNKVQTAGWKMGSPGLNLLKNWGYQVRLYTSADLGYYKMDELLFGKGLCLIDEYKPFHHSPSLPPCDTDAAAISAVNKDLKDPSLNSGQVFVIFWDCTHFDYSWPKDWKPRFDPYAKEFAYFKTFHTEKNIELIKNRYRNAVHYMDSLFGKFLDNLPNKEEAIVVVMGDHGEEFFEHGHLFHNSHLTHEQTNIPLYFKFGKNARPVSNRTIVSQMDIFPSIADYLKGSPVSLFAGQSIFQEELFNYAITARFNGGQTPYEFSIHNGKHKLIAQFLNKGDIFQANGLQIRSLRSAKDKSLPESPKVVQTWVEAQFGPALEKLTSIPLEKE